MSKHDYYIGLMSGTSVDSIDAALVDFSKSTGKVVSTYSLPVPQETKQNILALTLPGDNEISRMRELDQALAKLFSDAALATCKKSHISAREIKAIGSHGQTIRHYPKTADTTGFSLQIADPNIIAECTGITTIADFRRRDIAAGGHGAPLAPAFHAAVFGNNEKSHIVINLGGIANLSYIPPQGDTIGFDSGPANILLDSWCQQHKQQAYDHNGLWAKSGEVSKRLLSKLLDHPYFALPYPKSTGRETFNSQWLQGLLNNFDDDFDTNDVQATLLALTTQSIAQAVEQLDRANAAAVYICGGGAKNETLMHQLGTQLAPRKLDTTTALGIEPEWVECAAFAWLAKQTMEHQPSNLPTVTGAKRPVILGGVYWGN